MAPMSNPGMGPDSPANRTSRFRPQTSLAEELARAQNFTGAKGAAFASLEGESLYWLGAVGENQPRKADRWSLAGSFATLCLGRRTRPQKCDDVEADGRMDSSFRGLQAKSMALAPVHDGEKVTGLLAVFSDNPKAFNGMHVAVLQTQADAMAELLQAARQAAGLQDEAKTEPAAPAEQPRPVEAAPAPAAEPATPPAPATQAQHSAEAEAREIEALESAFVVIPPPVTAPPPAPAAEAAPPIVVAPKPAAAPAAVSPLPKLTVVPTPAPSAAPTPSAERPSLPGFMPLSATAAALAKAKPSPPTPPEMVVETKAPKPVEKKAAKPVAPSKPAPEKKQAAPAPAPKPAAAKPAPTPVPIRPSAPAAKFVPMAKPPEVKTPPPGTLKPASKSAEPVKPAPKSTEHEPLPAAADPFVEFSPAFVRAQARAHTATASTTSSATTSPATLTGLETSGHSTSSARNWKLPLMAAAAVAVVVLGGVWLRTRSHAATAKTAPAPAAVTQPAPASVTGTEVPSTQPATAQPATQPAAASAATAAPAPVTAVPINVPANKTTASADKAAPAPEKTSPPVAAAKSQPTSPATKTAAASVAAPSNLEVKGPAEAPVVVGRPELPPKNLSVPADAAARMPDLPKPEVAAVPVRQASTPVPAQLLSSVTPVYPSTARAMRLQSVVRLSAKVNAQGRVTDITWISGNSFFKDAAFSAVKQWRYKPASLDGQAVESTVEIILKFSPQ